MLALTGWKTAAPMTRMQLWIVLLAWCLNVLVLSLALALLEIFFEKEKGWASGANPRGAGRKLFRGSVLSDLCEKPYLTAYHLFVFGLIVPLILAVELWLLGATAIGPPSLGIWFLSPANHLVMKIGGVAFVPIFFFIAAWSCIFVVEDLLWFLLNWHYPRSMQDLLSGKIWWHTRWLTLGSIKLPRFYFTTALIAAAFLAASLSPLWLPVAAATVR